MLAALLALTSCSDDDNTSPTPAKAVLGEWFTQVNTNGVLDGIPYDAYALLVTFQEDGHGLFTQYFLKDGKLVNALGSMTDYTVDSNGNISIVVSEVKVPLGENVRIACRARRGWSDSCLPSRRARSGSTKSFATKYAATG